MSISKRTIAATSKRQQQRRGLRQAVIETLENRQLLSLVIDVRLPGGGKTATVSTVGQQINFQIWATVKGSNSDGSDDGLQTVIGSFLSTNVGGGAALGTLSAGHTAPFNALGSQPGTAQDLDGDGDPDLGSNDPEAGSDYWASRAGSVIDSGGTVGGASQAFQIGTGTFTVTSLKTGGTTNLNFRIRPGITALWREDGNPALKNPTDGTMSVGSPIVLTRGTSTAGSISGVVFNDANKNNTDDGEAGLSGVKVFLDTNKNGTADTGEPTTTTDAGGNYFFGSLAAGSYRVREVAPGGFTISSPASGFFDLTLTTGQNLAGENFANQGSGGGGNTASIAGKLFNDANKNGVFDSGDTLLSARKIYIDKNGDNKFDTGDISTTTAADGTYKFTGLAAGSYHIGRADTPAGYSFSVPASGFWDISLTSGQTATGKDFGVFQGTGGGGNTASISGKLFNDGNKNGVFDSGDTALSARKIYIDKNNDNKFDTGDISTLTGADGSYSFTGLAAGSYHVGRADTPAGYSFSTPSGGFWTIALTAGQAATGKNFGVFQGSGGGGGNTASISGTVFSDNNKNGVFDAGDTTLPSKKIYLDMNNDGKFDTGDVSVLANSSGVYTFTGLAAGTYHVGRADVPSGFKLSVPSGGFYTITLSSGQSLTGKNIGAVPV